MVCHRYLETAAKKLKFNLINCLNPFFLFSHLIKTVINVILRYFKVLINCPKITYKFWHMIELIFNFLAAVCRYPWQTNFECKVSKEKENKSNHSFVVSNPIIPSFLIVLVVQIFFNKNIFNINKSFDQLTKKKEQI